MKAPAELFDLSGRVAVVTGGYRGIGYAIAASLAAAGSEVSIWARDEERMAPAAAELGAQPVVCDVADRDAVEEAMDETLARFGRVDAIFANAGTGPEFEWVPEGTGPAWDKTIAVNLNGVHNVCQAAARHMVERGGGGKIVVTSSVRAGIGTPHGPAYSASKAGVEGMVRSYAVALAAEGVQVNAIRAGWVETEMAAWVKGTETERDLFEAVPAGRWATPEDFAGLAVYLASAASDFHTGDCISLDGGFAIADPIARRTGS